MKTRPQTRLKATIENRLHGCGLRRSPEGERKALWSRPQTRFPCDRQNQDDKNKPTAAATTKIPQQKTARIC